MSKPDKPDVYRINNHYSKDISYAFWTGESWNAERDTPEAAKETEDVSLLQLKQWLPNEDQS